MAEGRAATLVELARSTEFKVALEPLRDVLADTGAAPLGLPRIPSGLRFIPLAFGDSEELLGLRKELQRAYSPADFSEEPNN